MKAIIYYRKSTDRDDYQANSLEHQLTNCSNTAGRFWLEIEEKLWESRSAKIEGTRPKFNTMIQLCKRWNIDYIIIDEPKRLSRNNIDTSRIIDLLDKKQIKWVLATSREYRADNSRDKFLLQLDLSLSKMDNEDRSKDISDKMDTCIKNQWRFLWKAPFGYNNITIRKGHKDIEVNKKQAKIVKDIFAMRIENKAYSMIVEFIKSKYGENTGMTLTPPRIQKLVSKKFYYWVFLWKWKEIQGSHTPIISKEIYDEVNKIETGVYERPGTIKDQEKYIETYPLKGFVRDISGFRLSCYKKKWHSYYISQVRSPEKINVNENIIFDKFWEILKEADYIDPRLKKIDKEIIFELLKQKHSEQAVNIINYEAQIEKLKIKQSKLLDMQLEDTISKEVYLEKNNTIEEEIQSLQAQKTTRKNDDFEAKTQIMIELAGSLYSSYYELENSWKAQLMKKLLIELSVDNKKELHIGESPLMKSSKMLHLYFGIPTENWTPISALRRPHPNH